MRRQALHQRSHRLLRTQRLQRPRRALPRGGKYRQRRTEPLPEWAVAHHECNGTGLVACGCTRLTPEVKEMLKGKPWAKGEERWSTHAGHLITKPKRVRRPRPTAPTLSPVATPDAA